MGKRKVFLRLQVYEPLESSRIYTLNRSAILLQSHWRRFVVRRCYLNKRNAALVLQHAFKGWQLRLKFIQRRRAAIVIQSHLRGMFAREVAMALREMRRVEEIEAKQRERDKIAAQEMEAAETLEEVSSISDQVIYFFIDFCKWGNSRIVWEKQRHKRNSASFQHCLFIFLCY